MGFELYCSRYIMLENIPCLGKQTLVKGKRNRILISVLTKINQLMVMIWPKGLSLVKVKDNLSIVYNGHQKTSEVTVEILPGICFMFHIKIGWIVRFVERVKIRLISIFEKGNIFIICIYTYRKYNSC